MRIKISIIFLLMFLFVSLVATVNALVAIEQAKLTASDGGVGDAFGIRAAISGDFAVVGETADDDMGDSAGATYIFQRNGTVWAEQVKLTASDGDAGDGFGGEVAISGDLVAISAIADDDLGNNSGAVYIFQRNGNIWTQVAKLTASDGAANGLFGNSMAIGGDTVVVSAVLDNDVATNAGAVYIFQRHGNTWTQVAKLTASDGAANDNFGNSVAISGGTIVVGAGRDDDLGTTSGSAYIFQRSGRNWTQVAKLTASDGEAGDRFGASVDISGDTVVVGAWFDDDLGTDSGAAYIFQRLRNSWVEVAKLTASDGAAGDEFGWVAISEGMVVSGAWQDDDLGTDSGAAYVYRRQGRNWVEVAKLTASDGAADDKFGLLADISGNAVLVTALDDFGAKPGSAYIFQLH